MGCLMTAFIILMFTLLGLPLICAIGICIYFSNHSQPPTWWKVLTISVGIIANIIFVVDLSNNHISMGGPLPILIIFLYGAVSYHYFLSKNNKYEKQYNENRKTKAHRYFTKATKTKTDQSQNQHSHQEKADIPMTGNTLSAKTIITEIETKLNNYFQIYDDENIFYCCLITEWLFQHILT